MSHTVELSCDFCWTTFTVPYRHRDQKYCSRACFAADQRRTASQRSPRPIRQCLFCGRQFTLRRGAAARRQHYCSRNCYQMHASNATALHNCATCGKTVFVKPSDSARGRGKYCSMDCRRKAERDRAKSRAKDKAAKPKQRARPTLAALSIPHSTPTYPVAW